MSKRPSLRSNLSPQVPPEVLKAISQVQEIQGQAPEPAVGGELEANPPHGEKGDFLKVTATLSPEVYKLVSDEMLRRKLAREPNAQLSAILREAVVAYLGRRE